jgi:hypothetical protein
MSKFLVPVLLALPVVLAGCNKKIDLDDYSECGSSVPAPPPGYKVLLRLGGTSAGPVLDTRDNQTYACTNYVLNTALINKDGKLLYSVCEAVLNGACTTGSGPATTTLSLAGYQGGQYPLEINIRGQRTTGTLDLRAAPYQLTLADTTYIAVRR